MAGLASRFNRRLGVFSNFWSYLSGSAHLASARPKSEKTFTLAKRTTSAQLQQHVNRIANKLPALVFRQKKRPPGEDNEIPLFLAVPFWPAPQRRRLGFHRISRARRAQWKNMPHHAGSDPRKGPRGDICRKTSKSFTDLTGIQVSRNNPEQQQRQKA